MIRKFGTLITTAIVGSAYLLAFDSSASAAACVTIPAVAHRGGTEVYVENSANAFRSTGPGRWETDVRFTSDDVPVLLHDPDVDRTTDGTGPVADLTYTQVAALRTVDDQPVMTLRQLINDAQVDGARLFVELKVMPTEPQWAAFLAALGSRPALAAKIVVTSFDGAVLVAARAHSTAWATGLIQELGDQTAASVTQYAGTTILIKHHNAITAARMTAWTAGGLTVYSWTVDTQSEWERMSWYPALAGVVTGLPQAYAAWQKARTC